AFFRSDEVQRTTLVLFAPASPVADLFETRLDLVRGEPTCHVFLLLIGPWLPLAVDLPVGGMGWEPATPPRLGVKLSLNRERKATGSHSSRSPFRGFTSKRVIEEGVDLK